MQCLLPGRNLAVVEASVAYHKSKKWNKAKAITRAKYREVGHCIVRTPALVIGKSYSEVFVPVLVISKLWKELGYLHSVTQVTWCMMSDKGFDIQDVFAPYTCKVSIFQECSQSLIRSLQNILLENCHVWTEYFSRESQNFYVCSEKRQYHHKY